MKKIIPLLLIFALQACNNSTTNKNIPTQQTILPPNSLQNNGITLIPVSNSPAFSDAKLSLKSPINHATLDTLGKVKFDFEVQNYVLGNQTDDAETKRCANSAKGQHLHLILNNMPYNAYYTNTFEQEIPEGNYVALAFLSRSYHESLKHPAAYSLSEFKVGNPKEKSKFETKAPHLFYSRPKGEYIGEKEINQVLLDFYLLNTTLSQGGNNVKVTINNKSIFNITTWQPYLIQGLNEGENTLKLELIDKNGNNIPGPYNIVERKIKLSKQEPIKP